ncbi:MAG: leucine--tRNA ligase [Williamsia sp.]|nr:leucine--tRNA ligase [Williamsia sp.]
MEYNFREIEKKWQAQWNQTGAYTVTNDSDKPKFYVLDMFPYPSGAGLHVGHPLGYIASDIYSRYKRLKGFNVLHPMGYDSFGLPAEQYAIETGQHPAITTENNIRNFRSQLNKIGFCYDWSRELRTSDPPYYKWTQWIFLQLFDAWYDPTANKAKKIQELVSIFEQEGNKRFPRPSVIAFDAREWNAFDEKQQQDILMEYRLAYSAYGEVNWCEALGTVLANDEVINGLSERGGHPVVKKKMRQWYLRITAYADRLLQGLEQVEFSESLKEQQRNWIGRSQGAEIDFDIKGGGSLKVYTTRPDTIFGVDFMVLAPEHELVAAITTAEQKAAIDGYLDYVKSRSDRERMAEVKQITGCFTGAYALNPFDGREIPVWIAEYVLAGYGTGAIMAVPCGDQRDFNFARHFNIPVTNIIGSYYNGQEANPTKDAVLENSGFLDGMVMRDAINQVIEKLEEKGIGKRQINYRMRDAGYSRQRYWGEPFPIVWEDGIARVLNETELPLHLPHVDTYGPGPEGEGPLANIPEWTARHLETSTMPGYAGSSWYFLRYMDPHNKEEFCSRQASDYWGQVDLYIGGTEHAVGHLLYSRMWTKFLYDMGLIGHDEPYKKLVNQGMITGKSAVAKVVWITTPAPNNDGQPKETGYIIPFKAVPHEHADTVVETHLPVEKLSFDNNGNYYLTESDLQEIKSKYPQFEELEIAGPDSALLKGVQSASVNGQVELLTIEEKMSKRKLNTFTPDDIVDKYGADTFRMYEMFLGPIEQSKPWDTKGIEGVHRFLRKLWRLFFDEVKGKVWNDERAGEAELKVLHKTIRKVEEDTEKFSFNTAVSAFMVCVNELNELKCHKKEILEPLAVLLAAYAPHIAEELYHQVHAGEQDGNSVLDAAFPRFEEKWVTESSKEYPVSVNGKVRTTIPIALNSSAAEVETIALANETIQKWLEGRTPKKIIYVQGKMINIVV